MWFAPSLSRQGRGPGAPAPWSPCYEIAVHAEHPGPDPWGDLPADCRATAQGDLLVWVDQVLRRGWPELTSALKPCWPAHDDVAVDLRAQRRIHAEVMRPHWSENGDLVPPPPRAIREWQERLVPARDRWAISFRACPQVWSESEPCRRLVPPAHVATYEERWGPAVEAAATQAWRQPPSRPTHYLSPLELAGPKPESGDETELRSAPAADAESW
jgi:hypothetical protein